jgi:hypothetical protein
MNDLKTAPPNGSNPVAMRAQPENKRKSRLAINLWPNQAQT